MGQAESSTESFQKQQPLQRQFIPGLPDEIAMDCLVRVPHQFHSIMKLVCHSWRSLIVHPSFYQERRRFAMAEHMVCLIQPIPSSSPVRTESSDSDESASSNHNMTTEEEEVHTKSSSPPLIQYGLSIYNATRQTWHRMVKPSAAHEGFPMFCQCVALPASGKLLLLGGWDPNTLEPVPDVYVLDLIGGARWRRAAPMLVARSFFACGAVGQSTVYAAGGHDNQKNALRSAEVYDTNADEWRMLPPMAEERDECQGLSWEGDSRFWVVSGYSTDSQGRFRSDAECYDPVSGSWTRVGGVWPYPSVSPRGLTTTVTNSNRSDSRGHQNQCQWWWFLGSQQQQHNYSVADTPFSPRYSFFVSPAMVKKSDENGSDSVPPFLKKCYEMLDDEATDPIISWSQTGESFVISDMTEFSVRLLPKYFKHSNFSSFMRQLNIYGFRKIDTDRWEFANERFVQGQKHLLKNICRRKKSQQADNPDGPAENESIGNSGLWKEIENLKTDKNALMQELVKLKQHQETSDNKLLLLRDHLQGMEKNQQQMLSFLVMAMQFPGFLVQLLQPKENNWRLAEVANMLEVGTEDDGPIAADGVIVRYQPRIDDTPKFVQTRSPSSKKQQEVDQSPDGMKDYFLNAEFLKMLMDEKLCLDNHAPFILSDLPADGSWEQLFLANTSMENTEDGKLDNEEPMDHGMEVESTESGSQLEASRNFELLIEQMEKSQKLGME